MFPSASILDFLFQFLHELKKLGPFFLKEMHGDVVHFDMISDFTIGFFGFPCEEVFGLGEGAGFWFVTVVAHVNLLGWIWFIRTMLRGGLFPFFLFQAEVTKEASDRDENA